ncbi:MAG: methyltransferase family protein [Chthoniobacterales bacterium]
MKLPGILTLSAILLASEVALALSKRSKTKTPGQDGFTLPLLWVIIGLSIWAGFYCRGAFPEGRASHPSAVYLIGLIIFVLGLIVRWSAIVYLGRFFTVNVSIAHDHRLVTTGPYQYVRHPSYTGVLMLFFGFGLCLLNYFSLLAVFLPICIGFLWRMRVEEQTLREAFGQRYQEYAARTRRIIPFVF